VRGRIRQLLYRPRRGLGWPLWVDAPAVDLADHVRVHPLAAPGDEAQLLQACAQLYRRRLDPARPLWEVWFLPGLPERQLGLFLRASHVLADGVAGIAAFGALLDLSADAATPVTPRGRRPRCRRPASCWATTCAGASGGSAGGCPAWPIRPGRSRGRGTQQGRGASSSPSVPPTLASWQPIAPPAKRPSELGPASQTGHGVLASRGPSALALYVSQRKVVANNDRTGV
jgi:hypothetical protein